MCAAQSTSSTQKQVSSPQQTKPVPKWLKMKQQNLSSAGRTAKPTAQKSSSSAQQPNQQSRNEKRARWAKKNKPVAKKPVAPRRENAFEYISACCSLPARKPKAGQKEAVKDPESDKVKDKAKGLGKWRCSGCGKVAKVTPRKPQPKETPQPTIGGTVPDIIYPAKLQTPVLSAEGKAQLEGTFESA